MESILLRTTTHSRALAPGFEARRREEQLLRFRAELSLARRNRRRQLAHAAWGVLKSSGRDSTPGRVWPTESPDVGVRLR